MTSVWVYWKSKGDLELEKFDSIDVQGDEGSYRILELSSNTSYQVRVVPHNNVGPSNEVEWKDFKTPPPGYPGSPSHVEAKNLTQLSVVICWLPSEVNRPFTRYEIKGTSVNDSSSTGKIWIVEAKDVKSNDMESAEVCIQPKEYI